MSKGKTMAHQKSEIVLEKVFVAAVNYQVQDTPTIIFENGSARLMRNQFEDSGDWEKIAKQLDLARSGR